MILFASDGTSTIIYPVFLGTMSTPDAKVVGVGVDQPSSRVPGSDVGTILS